MEAKEYPIFGIQFHPEKSVFEWNSKEGIKHSEMAVKVNAVNAVNAVKVNAV